MNTMKWIGAIFNLFTMVVWFGIAVLVLILLWGTVSKKWVETVDYERMLIQVENCKKLGVR